jgi:lipoprotein NlpI
VTRTTTTRLIAERLPNLNSRKRLALKPKMDPERSLWLYLPFEEINALKRQLQLKPEKTASSKKRNKEG